ncbi:helix-turn-helix domain-containing protein [Agrobacterium larrymoorei]|uniref:AraC-like ligand-binding domain-containing protein n=1 Tax=Agrobacterium larrymoorei TaxID=160699 RepID=UPI0015720A94|nr:helix-turn-helix domain-containing protein [Agrobacterium larrymoorei]NTJ43857.1 helix-turn-helix domain-containing protein [Agrobacterium larrymoorei]
MRYVVDNVGGLAGGDAWQAAVTETYFPLDTEYRNRREFTGKLETWSLGLVGVSRMQCDGVSYHRHRRHFLNERDASLLVSIPEVSEINFLQGSRSVKCNPGGFLLERGDAPYEFWHGKPNALWVLKVPSASVRSRIGSTDRFSALSFDGTSGVAALFLDTVRTSIGHIDNINEAAREMTGRHILEMLCLSIVSDNRVLDSSISSIRAGHLHRAEQYIRDNIKNRSLGPHAVAEAGGISLRYLQGLFQESNKSINGFIRDSRLDHCSEELMSVTNNSTIAEIAYRWGFADQSQFCRHYRTRFGCSPGDTRREAALRARMSPDTQYRH